MFGPSVLPPWAGADGWQTFRHVTLPSISTALVAGGLLAFALSFDEIVVTTFTAGAQTTLPIWIFNQLRLPRTQPAVNVVAMAVILLSIVPVYLAQRLSRDTGGALPPRGGPRAQRVSLPGLAPPTGPGAFCSRPHPVG